MYSSVEVGVSPFSGVMGALLLFIQAGCSPGTLCQEVSGRAVSCVLLEAAPRLYTGVSSSQLHHERGSAAGPGAVLLPSVTAQQGHPPRQRSGIYHTFILKRYTRCSTISVTLVFLLAIFVPYTVGMEAQA